MGAGRTLGLLDSLTAHSQTSEETLLKWKFLVSLEAELGYNDGLLGQTGEGMLGYSRHR